MRLYAVCVVAALTSSPALAFDCPVGKGASVYDGVQGKRLRLEPRDDALVVTTLNGVAAVVVLEVSPDCRLPRGWARADHNGKSGYVREADLRPRVRPGMPE